MSREAGEVRTDESAVLRPAVLVGDPAGVVGRVAAVDERSAGDARSGPQAIDEAQRPELGRRPLHAVEVAAQRRRRPDDDNRLCHRARIVGGGALGSPGGTDPDPPCMIPMRIAEFELERFFAQWEFAVRHLLCASDVEPWPMADLLALADDESAALWRDLRLGYTESPGHPLLRHEISTLYGTADPDDILVVAGAEEGIFALVNVLLGPGDHAIVTWPGYQSLYEVARACGADVTLHELRDADGWAIDLDALRRQVTPRTKLIVINAPHNPTGMLPDQATYDAIVALAAEAGAYLLSDEVYRLLEVDEADRLPAGVDARAPRHLARRHVQVLRPGRAADRLARLARS